MSNHKFSYKEAIAHGWSMTKKYWKIILLVAFVYILIGAAKEVMTKTAGSPVTGQNIQEIYKDKSQAARLYKSLIAEGYIATWGDVQPKLQQVRSSSELALAPEFEERRADIYRMLNEHRYRLPFPKPVFYLLSFLFWVVDMLMSIGAVKISLMLTRDEEPRLAELFSNGQLLIPYILGSICYMLIVGLGFILLIVPGIILSLMLGMYTYLIVDQGLGPIEALKRSRVITKGSRGRLFVFGALLVLLNIGGLLCLVVGLFFTLSISSIAMAYVYERLQQTTPEVVS